MRLTNIQDIDSGKIWVSKERNHGDFPFRFVLRLQYTEQYRDDSAVKEIGKYILGLHVVSPQQAKETDAYSDALEFNGWTPEDIAGYGPYAEYEMLVEYGVSAHLWESSGNNLGKLMREARVKLKESDFLFGFAMDRGENAIGTTGWDAIRGDTLAPLRRHSEEQNVQLMQKLHGMENPDV